MRVIGGEWRGRHLVAPPGRDTRPTTDRAREAIFSSIFSIIGPLDGQRALDLYAGSGALGIEALSRGAAHVLFVERDRRAAAAIQKNLRAVEAPAQRWSLAVTEASRLVTTGGIEPVALLFADPPYTIDAAAQWQVLEELGTAGVLEVGCLVVYEHRAENEGVPPERFTVHAKKWYGDTGVTYAIYGG